MKQILLEFRKSSEHLYFVVISKPGGVSKEQKLKDRELFASWVLLIDSTIQAMEATVGAAMRDGTVSDPSALAEYSVELRILTEKIKTERKH